jgi:hypothetical protein
MHRLRDEEDVDVDMDVETTAVSSDGGSSQVKLWGEEQHGAVIAKMVADGQGERDHRMPGGGRYRAQCGIR